MSPRLRKYLKLLQTPASWPALRHGVAATMQLATRTDSSSLLALGARQKAFFEEETHRIVRGKGHRHVDPRIPHPSAPWLAHIRRLRALEEPRIHFLTLDDAGAGLNPLPEANAHAPATDGETRKPPPPGHKSAEHAGPPKTRLSVRSLSPEPYRRKSDDVLADTTIPN